MMALRVRPVLGHRDPDVGAVEVDAAGVVHVALAEGDVLLQVPLAVHDEQVPDALAGRAVVAADGGRVLLGRLDDLDGREEEVVRGDREALGVVRREVQLQLVDLRPGGVPVHRGEVAGERAVVMRDARRGVGGGAGGPAEEQGAGGGGEDRAQAWALSWSVSSSDVANSGRVPTVWRGRERRTTVARPQPDGGANDLVAAAAVLNVSPGRQHPR